MASPAEHLANILQTGSAGTLAATSGWGIFVSYEPPLPHTCITIYDTGGKEANPKWLLDFPSVQIRVRGAKGGYQNAYTRIKLCKDLLLGIDSQDIGTPVDRLVSITSVGDITSLGRDDSERPLLVMNFQLIIQPATSIDSNRESL